MTGRYASAAVMSRRVEPDDSLDFFPTPPWATRAFCEHVMPHAWGHATGAWPDVHAGIAWDPACGQGHMALALGEFFDAVHASDIFPYGFGDVADFLHPDAAAPTRVNWIVTNPPFNCAVDFVERALQLAERGVAMLVRTQFLEGDGRYKRLFSRRPPQVVAQFVERVPMHRGRWVVDGSTATAYCWLVWLRTLPHDWRHTRAIWIPPSRKALAKHDDWLRFAGCMDIPGLQGKATQLTLAETQALVKGGRQAEARQFELGALL